MGIPTAETRRRLAVALDAYEAAFRAYRAACERVRRECESVADLRPAALNYQVAGIELARREEALLSSFGDHRLTKARRGDVIYRVVADDDTDPSGGYHIDRIDLEGVVHSARAAELMAHVEVIDDEI
jgi:hypothetical protein